MDAWLCAIAMIVFAILAMSSKDSTESLKTFFYVLSVLSGIILTTGFIVTPNDPPHINLVTRWGERLWYGKTEKKEGVPVYLSEGYGWLFLRGIMYKTIPVNISKKEKDFEEITLTTPDKATTKLIVAIAYTASKKNCITYLNYHGGDEEILDTLSDRIGEKLRIWALSPTEGPKTWEELIASKEEINLLILKAISSDPDTLPEGKELKKLQSGSGKWEIDYCGIDVSRLNFKKMEPFGPVYDASLKDAIEQKEKKSETTDLETDLTKAKLLKDKMSAAGHTMDIKDCMEKIMEWKIRREGNDKLSISALAGTLVNAMKGENK